MPMLNLPREPLAYKLSHCLGQMPLFGLLAFAAPRNAGGGPATARLDRTSFGVIKKKGMVGRTVTVRIDAVGQLA